MREKYDKKIKFERDFFVCKVYEQLLSVVTLVLVGFKLGRSNCMVYWGIGILNLG